METMKKLFIKGKFTIIISSILILISCIVEKEKIVWSAAMSRPSNYSIEGPRVYYFYKGELIANTETLTTISGSWSSPQAARGNGEIDILPDSVVVNYGGLNEKLEMCTYEGGNKLPIQKIKELFKSGYIEDGEKNNFRCITTGLAPGGRICVWVDHIEICRFKVEQKDTYYHKPVIFFDDTLQTMNYLKHHPIDYSIWEKSEPRYDLDLGFCSEDPIANFLGYTLYSKEGVVESVAPMNIDITEWGKPYGRKADFYSSRSYQSFEERNIRDYKLHLPVHIYFQWEKKENIYYSTEVVMPKDFEQRFLKTYINPNTGKEANYNRIVLGVEKGGEYGIVWLDGPGKQEKIIRFKGVPENIPGTNVFNKEKYPTEITYY